MTDNVLYQISLWETPDLKLFSRGKVRDIYETKEYLIAIATDRISAFDVVLPDGIPGKGRVLTGLSAFWFHLLKDITRTHFVTADFNEIVAKVPLLYKYVSELKGRTMLARKLKIFPVECIVRGYLAGSGWQEYSKTQQIFCIKLPVGMKEAERLKEPIFTPSTKAAVGHDQNISFDRMVELIGKNDAEELRRRSLGIYTLAHQYALAKGIIIADTKFEWGKDDKGEIVLADEILTPDSSRFWPLDSYAIGKAQPSFDKQFVRDYLATTGWDKSPPAPILPDEIIAKTSAKYLEAYKRLTK
jgi:phosphoribosylaminoimidazole-succinocarboxamide synthase